MEYEEITDLKGLLSKSVEKYENKILYKLEEKNITYKEMYEKVNSLGTALIQLGLKNKKIAIISENRYEWEISYFSITCGTGIALPLDKSLTKNEIITILKRAEVEAIFCSEKYEKILIEVQKEIKELKYIISFDKENEISFTKLIEKGKKLINLGNSNFIDEHINNENIGVIMFTSGTTEKSKAVMLSHKNICSNIINVSKVFPITNKDIALSVLPLNHVLEGIFCLLITIYNGATRIYCNDLNNIVEDINKNKVSFMGAVPAIYDYLYNRIEEINTENINIFMSGGASLDSKLEKRFNEYGIKLVQGYGITETSPVISMSNKKTYKNGSVGKVIPNVQVKIIDKDDNGIGQITVKGENVFLGYYKDSKLDKEFIKDGWFYTGDLGKLDDEGYLYINGRLKNMIVLPNGKKVFPEEIELKINKINGVKECFVFERKEGNKTIICVKIVSKNRKIEEIILKQIRKLNENMPKYKNITKVYISDEEIYKTPTGKIKRKEELERINLYINKDEKGKVIKEKNQTEEIKEIITKQLGIKEIDEKINIANYGADSLDKVQIILQIEKKYNIKIPKEKINEMNTLEEINKNVIQIIK